MTLRSILILSAALLIAGCADGPRDITVGAEECAHCRMIVSEEAFAAQLRTAQGRSLVFDSIECMAEFVRDNEASGEVQVGGMWVTDFASPGTWLPADEAFFLQSRELRSPMGLNLSAYGSSQDAAAHRQEFGGELLRWADVLEVVADVRVAGEGHGPGH
jgi:copper chaperone NosL